MINLFKNKRIILSLAVAVSSLGVVAFAANPGSGEDPLISLSYFEDKIEKLKDSVFKELSTSFSTKFDELEKDVDETLKEISENGISSPSSFELITLGAGQKLICEEGTEIIVRSGKSQIVTSKESTGGISDITAGKDLPNGETIINNHLLIVPKTDGRGIKATVTGAVMIKGKYTKEVEGI